MSQILQENVQYCNIWDILRLKKNIVYMKFKFNWLSCILSGNFTLELLKSGHPCICQSH